MTRNDRDSRAGGRVDSAIMVTIRSAGVVNEAAEALKAEEGLRCVPWWLKEPPHDPAKTNNITDKFKSALTEFGAGGLQRAVIVSEDHHRGTSLSHMLGTKQLRLPSAPKATPYHSFFKERC